MSEKAKAHFDRAIPAGTERIYIDGKKEPDIEVPRHKRNRRGSGGYDPGIRTWKEKSW
jgi:hypothetical protein